MDGGVRAEEVDRLVDAHREHVADSFAFEAHSQRFRVKARAVAHFAQYFDVGQEAHFDALDALAFAALAAPALGVEGEAARGVAAHARFARIGKQPAYRVPKPDVSRRTRPRRLADRRLVAFEHAADLLPAPDVAAADQRRRLLLIVLAHPV